MVKSKKFSAVISLLLVVCCVLGLFTCCGITLNNQALPCAHFTLDQRSGTVKKASQEITGKIGLKSDKVTVSYKIYADIDKGNLSFAGKAAVHGDTFKISNLKLKPDNNKIIVTAKTADGKTESQTVSIKYDSSSIKESPVKNIAAVARDSELHYVNNNLLVYFKENVSDIRRQEIINTVDGICVGYINGINMWQVEVKPTSFNNLKKMAETLTSYNEVFYASYNLAQPAKSMAVTPSDPWYYNNGWDEQDPDGGNWSVEAVQAPSAWDYQRFYSHINVGIVDAGIQSDHEDLTGKVFFPDTQYEKENDPSDDHGTHVAGIMGAIPNNSKGVTGILWDTFMYSTNWAAKFSTDADIYEGLTATVQAGAKVVNFSLGAADDIEDYSYANFLINNYAHNCEAVMTPLLNAGYDFIVVQAAGNGNKNGYSKDAIYNGYFCSVTYNNLSGTSTMRTDINNRIIIVGAAENIGACRFQQAYFSNAGSQVDICAPGYDVYSCYAGNSYDYMSGTSMASPMVAAITALTWSVNPALTGAQIRNIILDNTCYTVADNTSYYHPLTNTYRMVNAKLAVEAAIATHAPDYTQVNKAVAAASAIDATLYTPESWAVLTSALNAVNYNLPYIQQIQIDTMAKNINKAISSLVYKTVPYTVEYRLNTTDGIKLAPDKTGTGQITYTVTETAIAISGYTSPAQIQSLKLSVNNNKIVFLYITKPNIHIALNTYKVINGEFIPITTAKAGDVITVTVTPTTDFFCASSSYAVMYDSNFYTIVGSGSSAFTPNIDNSYYTNTAKSCTGTTASSITQWPNTFTNGESSIYKFTYTIFSAPSSGYPAIMNDGKWLFSFNLKIKPDATGSGRIFMDSRWIKSATNSTGLPYFSWCESGAMFNSAGYSLIDYTIDLANADKYITLGTSTIVNFNLNGGAGTIPHPQEGEPGSPVELPSPGNIARQNYTFSGWAATPDAATPLSSYEIPANDSTLYAVWSRVPVSFALQSGSSSAIDPTNTFIYGLKQGLTKAEFENNFVDISGDGSFIYTSENDVIGTGTEAVLVDNTNGQYVTSYMIVIFGDVNGDGYADGSDASMVSLIAAGLLSRNDISDAAYLAADVNHDGTVDIADAQQLEASGLFLMDIRQTP